VRFITEYVKGTAIKDNAERTKIEAKGQKRLID
jgi:hypothetical protein